MHTTKNYLKIKPLRNASLSDDDYSTDYSLWGRGMDMVKPDRSWKFLIQYRRMRCWFRIIVNDDPQHFSVAQWKKSEIIQNIEFLPLRNSLTATASKTRERELWRQRRRRKINWKFAPQTLHWQLHTTGGLLMGLLYPLVILIFNIWLEANCYKMKESNKLWVNNFWCCWDVHKM